MANNNYSITGNSSAVDPRFNSGDSYDAVGEREQLANFISMITRDETPFMSDIGKSKASGVYHEWQTDELQAPRDSRVKVGADYENVAPDGPGHGTDGTDNIASGSGFTPPRRVRLGNYTQINAKTVSVSGTKRAVDQAGVADEYAYQLKKRGVEMRRDMERDLIHTSNTAAAQVGGTGGMVGTYRAWINADLDTEGSNGLPGTVKYHDATALSLANEGIGTHAPTLSGTNNVQIDLEDIDEVMQAIYENGGKAGKLMMSPKNRRDFSSVVQASGNVRRNIDERGSLRQSVDVYMSDFGEVMVVPNYIMGLNGDHKDEAVLIYDSSWFNFVTLRPMQEVDVGQKGDSTVGMFVEEWSFEVRNPYGCGAIYGLNQTS